jgi:carbon monoxide dehydrogenase subunit G
MKVTGSARLSAPPERVFEALHDPEVLVATIPGVQTLERVDGDRYKMTVVAGVASIKGAYDGEVVLTDQQPPKSFTMRAKGAGAPGTVDATVRVSLAQDDGGTRLDYDADAIVGGMVGGVGQRMLTGVSRKMAAQFFGSVEAVLTGVAPAAVPAAVPAGAEAAVPAGVVSAPTAAPAATRADVFRAPVPARGGMDDLKVPFWIVLAGVGAGAFWALVGVLVGWRIARRSER